MPDKKDKAGLTIRSYIGEAAYQAIVALFPKKGKVKK